jgi:hypothetical protein
VATNTGGTASTAGTASSTIVAAPVAPAISAPANVTAGTGLTATITNTASEPTGTTYAWTITGASPATGTGTSVTVTAGASGTVQFSCVATNTVGTASTAGTASSTIVAVPVAPVISAPANVTAATGLTATITNTASEPTGTTYAWTITGGSPATGTGTSVTVTAGASGTVQFSCVATNTGGTASAAGTASSTIVAAPTQPTVTGVPSYLSAGVTSATASVPAQGTSTYDWTVTGGTITAGGTITDTTVTFTAGAAGTLTVSCSVCNQAGTLGTAGTATGTIVALPDAPTLTVPPDLNGLTPPYSASATIDATDATVLWTISTGTVTGATTTSITFDNGDPDFASPFTLSCTASNLANSTATASVTYTGGQAGSVVVTVSDAANDDWATIGVRLLKIGLIPQGGPAGGAVTVYNAPSPAPVVNLAQLDQLSELLGRVAAPPGTYTGAVLTLGGNPGDVVLVSSAEPSAGFPELAATAIPATRIQIQGTTGSAGNLTVPVTVGFASPLAVSAGQPPPLDLEFELSHPAFLVDHRTAADPAPIWAVNFIGTVRQRPVPGTGLVLRHLYGTVPAVAGDPSALTVAKVFPTWPPADPETAVTSVQSLKILADPRNGTLCYDLDTGTVSTVMDFSSLAGSLSGRYVRAAVRYQPDGTLVAARIWAGSTFNTVYNGPEGHVLHVDAGGGVLTVANQDGVGVPILVTPATRFFFRNPADAAADATPIGSGPAFMGTSLVRGFKVHASVDPAATPMTAQTVDIEVPRFEGAVTASGSSGLTYTRTFTTAADDYTVNLGYSSAAAAAGSAPPSFLSGGAGPVSFGGTVPNLVPWGVSYAVWNDPAAPAAWAAQSTLPQPALLPLGTVASPWSGADGSFGLALPGSANAVAVSLDVSAGSATLVYRVDRTGNLVTLTPVDITTAAGQAVLAGALVSGEVVRVYGVPQNGGQIMANALLYYTGTLPALASAAPAPAS